MRNFIEKLFIVAFTGWVSFFPEPVQIKYQAVIKLIILLLFFFLWFRANKSMVSRKNLPLLVFLFCLSGGVISAKDKLLAMETYSGIALPLFSLCLISAVIFSSEERFILAAKTICIFSMIVALWGIADLLLGKNILYERLIYNQYYDRYLACAYFRRPLSTQFNPAPLGTYLLACIPFGLFLAQQRKSFLRILGILSPGINITVLILTFSRAAFAGLIAAVLFFLWFKRKKLAALFIAGIFVLTVTISSFVGPGRGFDRFGVKGMIFGQDYTSPLSNYRMERVRMVSAMLKDYPLFGIGLNHIRTRFFDYFPEKREVGYEWRIADNMYLTLLAETGIFGFTGFLIFILYLFREGIRSLHKLNQGVRKEMLMVGLSALLGLLVNMSGYELFYWHIPFYLFCLLCGLVISSIDNTKTA